VRQTSTVQPPARQNGDSARPGRGATPARTRVPRPAATEELLKAVRTKYLGSGDFNGLYIDRGFGQDVLDAATELVRRGLLQVVSEADYPNPHIRPWASRRTIGQQIGSLETIRPDDYGVCLYPTPEGMKGVRLPKRFSGRPYEQAIARGRGVLELAYFDFDVLEHYRNDPRYRFRYDDFGADMSVSDEVYFDDAEPDRDKVSLSHIGFAYDLDGYDPGDAESPVVRRVAAFYGDLARLTPEHQQRWRTYQVADGGLRPHPVWYGTQMGRWPDGAGPLYRMIAEMENINDLWANAFGVSLFKSTERPRELGWLLRASQREWDEFVHQLDKLLSENLDHKALDACGAPKTNPSGQNLSSMNRLQEFMLTKNVQPSAARAVMKPFREVREARQRPAHALRSNVTNKTFIHKQIALLEDINGSLINIRHWLATHPENRDRPLVHNDEAFGRYYRM